MPFCSDCLKHLPPEPRWPPEGYTQDDAPTTEWVIHGVDIEGGLKLCLNCWEYRSKLNNKKW